MVLENSSDYGVDGVPHVPRAARSVRRRSLLKNKGDDQQMRAFDLLATVAGDLLSDRKSSSPSVVEDCSSKEEDVEDKPSENLGNQVIQERNFLCTELISEAPDSNTFQKELPCAQNDAISRPTSLGFAEQLVDDCKLRLGICTPRENAESSGFRPSVNCNRKQIKANHENSRNLSNSTMADISSSGHLESSDNKLSTLVSSVDSVKLPFCKDHSPCGSFPINRENVKLVNRDDDENFCRYSESSNRDKAFSPPANFGDCRIRKLPKVSQKQIDDECFDGDTERCNYLNRKNSVKWQRSLRDYPLKKRKLYDCTFASNSGERIKCDKICSGPEDSTNGGAPSSSLALQGGKFSSQISLSDTHMRTNLAKDAITPTPASAANENANFSSNHQVKLKIKSFRVPEMFLEFPESTTVGSLKKTVMEAVNAVFGGGLRVGVVLQGKKIRDDNRTLLQSGISRDNKMDTLGFTLEPSSMKTPIKFRREDRSSQLPHDGQPPPTRSFFMSVSEPGNLGSTPPEPRGSKSNNCIENGRDSTPFPPEMSSKKTISESKALVSVPSMVPDAMAVVPFQKSKRSESSQRRIRRPFSVSEVEALVHAVEKLGTGRWRDVKLRAFDNAKHRTYVDLKDKWKTLVHTARISPQQRRGEPVPQELLDRVLAAHAYWSHHQARHQLKSQPDTCLLL